MRFVTAAGVRVFLPKAALASVFDECDRYDSDETGGRIVGTYEENDGDLCIRVQGVIEPGPAATRDAVSFFQDGPYQESVFRRIEETTPEIEHLGNWHTHHVNGLTHLSDGDISTYRRIVNHAKHNTSLFYALLVVARQRSSQLEERYRIKHYVLRRGDDHVYEIPSRMVTLSDDPVLWPAVGQHEKIQRHDVPSPSRRSQAPAAPIAAAPREDRVFDRDILSEMFPSLRPFASPKLGVYWRGPLELVNGEHVELVLLESNAHGKITYSVRLNKPPVALEGANEQIASDEFPSARVAAIAAERLCNRVLFSGRRKP